MNTGVMTLRKRWLAMGAVAALGAIALAAGTLFAASERQQPETQPLPQQSVADAADPGLAPDLLAAPPAPERVTAQPDDNDEEAVDLPPIVKSPPKHPNLDSHLNRLVEEVAAGAGQQPNTADSTGSGSGATAEPVLVTLYIEPAQVDSVRAYLEDNSVFVRNVGEDWIEAHVPPLLLPEASERPGVRRVDTVIPPQPQSLGRVVSQGVSLHGADAWHSAGYRGQGVKVGVIDTGFRGFSRLQGSELPANVTARCYPPIDSQRPVSSSLADCEANGAHGTAVAETLIDVAPGVALYIANPRTKGDLRNAVDWMAGQGVKVINHSITWVVDGSGNGRSRFSNSPLRTVDAAVSSGITWVTAGGNDARKAWYGRFSNPNRSTTDVQFHHWSSSDVGNSFMVREGESINAFMRWEDTWGTADCDLDLVLWNYHPITREPQIVGFDTRAQDGGPASDPFAWIPHGKVAPGTGGQYFLTISKDNPRSCPNDPTWIQLIAWIDSPALQYHSPTHHISNPAESRSSGMMAAGATHHWETDTIADYSSRGPTIDGRTKPDITGITCNTTAAIPPVTREGRTQYRTCGTSYAAAHISGLAALVRQRFPNYTPAQTVDYLQRNARERGTSGKDNTWGYGLAALPDPSSEPAPAPTPASGQIAPTANIAVRDGANAGEVVISWDAVAGATHYRIGYVNMVTDYPLAKASVTGDWINAFIYVDEDARNLPVSSGRVEYTLRRLAPGVRHALTVLTSNDVVNNTETIGGKYYWPQNPRWRFHTVAN